MTFCSNLLKCGIQPLMLLYNNELSKRNKELVKQNRELSRMLGEERSKVEEYEKLAAKYGPAGAKAVLAAAVLLTPVPLPGTTLLPIALAEGVRRLYGLLKKQKTAGTAVAYAWAGSGTMPDAATILQEAKLLLSELRSEVGNGD